MSPGHGINPVSGRGRAQSARLVVWLWAWLCTALLAGLCLAPNLGAVAGPPPAPPEAQRFFDAGNYRQAATALEEASGAAPTNAALQYWQGRCFYELRDYGKAVSSFEHATMLAPDVSEYHHWLGRASGRRAEETHLFAALASLALARRVEHEFTTAVRLDPSNIDAQRDLIRFLVMAPVFVGGSEDRAQKQIEQLAPLDSLQAQLAGAELLADRKRFDEAGEKYQQILAGKPRAVTGYLEIAAYYRDREDGAHLLQVVNAAAGVAPADPRLLFYRGVALILSKQDPALAEDSLRRYLATVPDNSAVPSHALAHDWLGQLFVAEGKLDQAVAQYRVEVALDPRNKAAHETLSRLEKQH